MGLTWVSLAVAQPHPHLRHVVIYPGSVTKPISSCNAYAGLSRMISG